MKRILTLLVMLASVCPAASAQWYLFRGNRNASEKTEPEPVVADLPPAGDNDTLQVIPATDSIPSEPELFELDIPEEINLTLVLPLLKSGTSQPNTPMYDFYCGAMLAAGEWGARGRKICVNVVDSESCSPEEIGQAVTTGDVVIYAADSLESAASLCGKGRCVVAPLSSPAERDSLPIVQVATPWRCQIENLASWIALDASFSDDVIILDNKPQEHRSDTLAFLMESLDRFHRRYKVMDSPVDRSSLSFGTSRYVCVSNDNRYLSKVLQNIAALGKNGAKVAFYSTSRCRNLRSLEDSETFYLAGARLVAQYGLDYADSRTLAFVDEFRKFSRSEPSRFAFHGYDVANCFLSACSKYGRNWKMKLDELPVFCGIQSEFEFRRDFEEAMTNTACCRITYNPDLSLSVIR